MLNGIFINYKEKLSVQSKKAYEGVAVELHSFLNLTLDRGEWSASCLSHFRHRGKDLVLAKWKVGRAAEPDLMIWRTEKSLAIAGS